MLESYEENDPIISRFPRLISKAINSRHWKFSSQILEAELEEEQAKSGRAERV